MNKTELVKAMMEKTGDTKKTTKSKKYVIMCNVREWINERRIKTIYNKSYSWKRTRK